jgi:hypothetical protein
MENKKKCGTIPIIQGSRFSNENKQTETPLDGPRTENGRNAFKRIHSNPEGRRRTGRQRKRWVEDVEEDLKKMDIRGWRRKAKEKNEWANVFKEAKVLLGL